MSTLTNGLRLLRCQSQLTRAQWAPVARSQLGARFLSTESQPENSSSESASPVESKLVVPTVPLPFQKFRHARTVPATPSYFSREPQFNDIYLRIARLLTKYHHLPTVPSSEAPPTAWVRLKEVRSKLGEPVKASHFAKVLRVAKRLNLIEPTLFPKEVKDALREFQRDINPFLNRPLSGSVDFLGRAVGVGKRKESTARAWVVEGTGEVLINGKTLSNTFGRVHDRESAVWALQATERLDKYNVWALVEGGGTTGQAEALTMAVAKALIVHEPALKTALRKAGCITRDPRTVERKKHGHVKARKMPAWVKR